MAVGVLTVVLFGGDSGDPPANTVAAASPSAQPSDRAPSAQPNDYEDLDDLGPDDDLGDVDVVVQPDTPQLPTPPALPPLPAPAVPQRPAGGTAPGPVINLPVPREREIELVDTVAETWAEPVTEVALAVPEATVFALPHPEPKQDQSQVDDGPYTPEASDIAAPDVGELEMISAEPKAAPKPKKDTIKKDTKKGDKPKGNQDRPKSNKDKSKAGIASQPVGEGITWPVTPDSVTRDMQNVRSADRHGERFVVLTHGSPEPGQDYLGGHVATS